MYKRQAVENITCFNFFLSKNKHKMRLSHNVYELVGIFVTLCVGLVVGADETQDLARGTVWQQAFSTDC